MKIKERKILKALMELWGSRRNNQVNSVLEKRAIDLCTVELRGALDEFEDEE